MPCWDRPSDKATLDLTARVPATVKLGSNGRLADSTKIQDTIYYHWVSRDPVSTYLMVVTGKVNYNLDIVYWHKISNPLDSVPMRFYYNAGENITNSKAVIIPMTTFYSQKFGEHPFEKNGFAALNNQFIWGGMENQTLTSICPGCWDENLISHEYAHQWFGDMITCATWADIFLNEGFATYCEALWYENKSGYTAYKNDINSDANYYLNSNPGWAIYNPSWAITTPNTNTLFNTAITYDKGACVLHMLRYVMGDSLFFAGMKYYANDPALKYGAATCDDFKNDMSTVYGSDLSWFFNPWLKEANHPTYANKYFISQQNASSWIVGFIAYQNQTNSAFHPMPLTVKISFSTGSDTTVRLMNTENNQQFTLRFNRQPTTVVFDPNNDIVLKTATLTQITAGPVLIAPANNTSQPLGNINFSWNSLSGTITYKLQISSDPLFSSFVLNDSSLTNPYRTVSGLTNGRYYWRALAKFASSNSPWSDVWTFTVGNNCKDVAMANGWNLVSVPLSAANMTTSNLFPLASSPAYAYSNGYTQSTTLTNGAGYWLRYSTSMNVSICGDQITNLNIPVTAGWNLVGVYQTGYPTNQISTNPAGILNSQYYGYQGNYYIAQTLEPGNGYWIRVTQNGNLVLPAASAKININSSNIVQPKIVGRLYITDAKEQKQTLSFSQSSLNNEQYDLPPTPPQGIFDIRFASGKVIEFACTQQIIQLQGCVYPLILQAEGVSLKVRDVINGTIFNTTARSGEKIVISNSALSQIAIESEVEPLVFALSQNYPNPFNPETKISFSLPVKSQVTIKVFNQIGEEIMTLAKGEFDVGIHDLNINLTSSPSGVYYYEMTAGDFHQVRKMIYLR